MRSLQQLVRAVGVVSVALGAVATVAPERVAAAGGVRDAGSPVVPLLVRLNAARQITVGLALLTRRVPVGRASGLFLPLTALDAAAVLSARRAGVLSGRSVVMALAVLTTNVAVSVADQRGVR